MACPHREQVGAFLDGALAGPARAACEAHLLSCPECALELERLRQVSRLLSIALQEARRSRHACLTCSRLRQRSLLRWSKALALAASFLFAVSGFLLFGSGGRPYSAADLAWEQAAVAPQTVSVRMDAIDPVAQKLLGMRP